MINNIRQSLELMTGMPLRIVDPVEFAGPVKFEELSETPLEFCKLFDTSPTVLNLERIKFQNPTPVTVTNFDDGQEGQYIIVVGDGQTIIDHGTNIFNTAGADITLANGRVYAYVKVEDVWREQGGTPTPNLAFASQALAANVTLINASTWYTALSVSLGAGTWLVNAHATFQGNHNGEVLYGARITDGTIHYASGQTFAHNKNPNTDTMALTCIISLASTTTISLQGITDTGGSVVTVRAQTNSFPSGNTATVLTALRIA